MPNTFLEVDSLTFGYNSTTVFESLSFHSEHRRTILKGPSGAGKTTVFNLLTGVYQTMGGRMSLGANNLVGLKPHEVAMAGIARTFQNIRLFPGLNVLDNVRLDGQLRARHGLTHTLIRSKRYLAEEDEIRQKAFELLDLWFAKSRKRTGRQLELWASATFGNCPRARRGAAGAVAG